MIVIFIGLEKRWVRFSSHHMKGREGKPQRGDRAFFHWGSYPFRRVLKYKNVRYFKITSAILKQRNLFCFFSKREYALEEMKSKTFICWQFSNRNQDPINLINQDWYEKAKRGFYEVLYVLTLVLTDQKYTANFSFGFWLWNFIVFINCHLLVLLIVRC